MALAVTPTPQLWEPGCKQGWAARSSPGGATEDFA